MTAITAVLFEYEDDVIHRVTDPLMGIQRELKFLPTLAEVSEACEKKKNAIAAEKKLIAKGWNWDGERWQAPAVAS